MRSLIAHLFALALLFPMALAEEPLKGKTEPVQQPSKVTILGDVKKRGTIEFEGKSVDILDVMAQVEPTEIADLRISLYAEQPSVTIIGQVNKQGKHEIEGTSADIFDAIDLAGGMTEHALTTWVQVRRPGKDPKLFKVNLKLLKASKEQFLILPSDVITVYRNRF